MNPTLELIRKNRDEVLSVAELLYGDGAWEISKALTKEEKRHQTEARIGLASNIVGIAAGGAGLATALRNPALKKEGRTLDNAGPVTGRAIPKLKKLSPKGKAGLIAAGAGGAAVLQAANLGGDFVSNRVLARGAKKKEEHIKKGLFKNAKTTTAAAAQASEHFGPAAENIASISGKIDRHLTKKKIALAGGGALTALGGSQYAGSYYGSKHGTRAGRKPKTLSKARDEISKGADILWRGEISKVDTDKRQVFGWASIIEIGGEPVIDLQGDLMTIDTIEKAAYDYVKTSRRGGNQHGRDGESAKHVSDMIESFIVTKEKKEQMGLPEDTPTGWWVGFQVNDDETWAQVKNGERKEFSIHGTGVRKDVDL